MDRAPVWPRAPWAGLDPWARQSSKVQWRPTARPAMAPLSRPQRSNGGRGGGHGLTVAPASRRLGPNARQNRPLFSRAAGPPGGPPFPHQTAQASRVTSTGTFTLSNLGMVMASDRFDAILPPGTGGHPGCGGFAALRGGGQRRLHLRWRQMQVNLTAQTTGSFKWQPTAAAFLKDLPP